MSAPEWLARALHRHDCHRCRMGWTCGGIDVDDVANAAVLWAEFAARAQQAREDVATGISVSAHDTPDYYNAWTDEADAAIAALLTAMGGDL